MARFPDNFTQNLSPEEFDYLPEWCSYEGTAPDLQHLRGLLIPTREVERVVYVGERENIWVTLNGHRERPWFSVWIRELDADGQVIVRDLSANRCIAKRGPHAMSAGELGAMNMSDADLDKLSREYLNKPWEPDSLCDSDLRRERFDEVMGVLHGKPP